MIHHDLLFLSDNKMYLVHQEFTSAVKIYLNLSLSGVVTYLLRGYISPLMVCVIILMYPLNEYESEHIYLHCLHSIALIQFLE